MDSDVELDLELERKVDKATQSNSPTPSNRGTLSPTFDSRKLVEGKEDAEDNMETDNKELEELLTVVQSEKEHGEQHGHEQGQGQGQGQGQQQSESRSATPTVDEATQKKVEEIDNGAAVSAAAAVANEQKQSKNNKKKKDK